MTSTWLSYTDGKNRVQKVLDELNNNTFKSKALDYLNTLKRFEEHIDSFSLEFPNNTPMLNKTLALMKEDIEVHTRCMKQQIKDSIDMVRNRIEVGIFLTGQVKD